jgi:virginiamycin B lyase
MNHFRLTNLGCWRCARPGTCWVRQLKTLLAVPLLFVLVACQPVTRQPEMPLLIEHKIPTFSAHAGGITVGADGALWFVETGTNQIGRITIDGEVTEYPVPTEEAIDPTQGFVGLGPDGAIWFNEDLVNKLGRITPDGTITEYDLPEGTGGIRQMVAGADGNLWVTATFVNKILKLSPDGEVLAEYTMPTADSRPVGMVVGPDEAFWFVENGANQIGRITLDGEITEYPIPTADSFPIRLTAGPDKALWFTMYRAHKIGRISLTGEITEYDVPGMGPVGIAAGADGALWFTGYQSTEIGRLTTDGALMRFSIPTYAAVPYSIVAGPDGHLWFTEQQGNQIGQIKLPTVTGVVSSTTAITPEPVGSPLSTTTFKLPMTFPVGPDWYIVEEYSDLVTLKHKTEGWELAFNLVTAAEVTDPVDPTGKRLPFPADFISWIQANPDFVAVEPTAVTVGGYPGIQLDATPTWTSTTASKKPFLHLRSIGWNLIPEPEKWRFILLDDVKGERVLILLITPPDAFDRAVKLTQEVFQTVAFRP